MYLSYGRIFEGVENYLDEFCHLNKFMSKVTR